MPDNPASARPESWWGPTTSGTSKGPSHFTAPTLPGRTQTEPYLEAGPRSENRAREVEIGVKADSIETCLSRLDAERLAREARTELGDEWLLIDLGIDGSCYGVNVEPEWGVIGVVGIDDGVVLESGSPTTLAPSNNSTL